MVSVPDPYLPTSCLDAIELADVYAMLANRVVDHVPTITDAIALARQGIASGDPAYATQAEDILRQTDSKIFSQFQRWQTIDNIFTTERRECKEELAE